MDYASCPVCMESLPVEELTAHVNRHFPSPAASPTRETVPVTVEVEVEVEQEVERLPTEPLQLVPVQTAEQQFQPNRNSLGLFERVYLAGRQRDGSSVLCISGPVQHFCAVQEDRGWGCGYRNCQMLISHLLLRGVDFRQCLFGGVGFVPDIASLQAWLECAWQKGYDVEGQHSLEGSVQGTDKKVGAVDIAAMLRQFGINIQFVDFIGASSGHHPNNEGGTVHGFACDICKTKEIVGQRHHSTQIPDFDVCEHCIHSSQAEACAPFTVHGKQEVHRRSTCTSCGTSPIVGVKYQHIRNWREMLCQQCYLQKSHLEQSLFRHHLKCKNSDKQQSNHECLTNWVWNYFTDGMMLEEAGEEEPSIGSRRFIGTEKPPLYFQHDGHSRMIVGIEQVTTTGRHASVSHSLIVFDPSSSSDAIHQSFQKGYGWQRLLKRGLHTLRHAEYQILYVDDCIVPEEARDQLKRCRAAEQLFS